MKIYRHKISFLTWLQILFIFTLLVYILGISITLMEPDAAVYADIPIEMIKNNNFFEVTLKGVDWLDKPHFQFWITALSYKIFSINNFGFKFPAILFSLIAAYYTFLFGKRFYSIKHGSIAALILLTAEHIIISNNDVRAEPFLAALTIVSLYYLAIYIEVKKFVYLVLSAVGLAGLLMTKGPFTILPVASGIGLSLIVVGKWKEIIHWQWIALIAITLILISPTLIAYYLQFDMHPEKEIFGKTGVSGVRFFFWDSQWGRFTNTGPIKGEGDLLFFIHTVLWAFAPWAILAYSGLFVKIREIIHHRSKTENYTIFGFIFTILVYSVSSFQLPHYLNQLFPFLAIITTHVIFKMEKNYKFLRLQYFLQLFTVIILLILLFLLHIFFFDSVPRIDVLVVVFMSIVVAVIIIIKEKTIVKKILLTSALIILSVNYYLNRQFYPALLRYQSDSEMAFYIKANNLPAEDLVTFEKIQWSADFYLKETIPEYRKEELSEIDLSGKLVFTTHEGLKILEGHGYHIEPVRSFQDFHVTTLNAEFINKRTRGKTLNETFLIYLR